MRKINEIKFKSDYPRFSLLGNRCFYIVEMEFGIIKDQELVLIRQFEKRVNNFTIQHKFICLFTGKDYFLYDVENNCFFVSDILVDFRIAEGSSSKFFRLANKSIPETLLYNIEKKQEVWRQEKYYSFQVLENNLLLDNQKSKVLRYDFNTGHPLWEYTLPEGKYDTEDTYSKQLYKGEIQRIIGVYEGILWVSLDRGNLLGLSAKEGQLIYDLAVPINFAEHFPDKAPRFGANYSQLDESRGVLFGMRLQYYWEINLQNPSQEYFLYDISSTCAETQTDASILEFETWLGDEVVFREIGFGNDPAKIGIFNRQSKQITWTSQELGEEGIFKGINKVELTEDRLYVLSKDSTLHVFQR